MQFVISEYALIYEGRGLTLVAWHYRRSRAIVFLILPVKHSNYFRKELGKYRV